MSFDLDNFINGVMNKVNQSKCVIQNEYVFQHRFYHFAKEILDTNKVNGIKIHDEIHLDDQGVMTNRGRFDFVVFDETEKKCYILELKCKTHEHQNMTIVNGFSINIGANTACSVGKESINSDVKRIEDFVKRVKTHDKYSFAGGCVVLLTDISNYWNKNHYNDPSDKWIDCPNVNASNTRYLIIRRCI